MAKLNLIILDSAKTFEITYTNVDEIVDKEFVKKLREKFDMTQLVFATVLGISKKTVEKWEQGKNPIQGTAARLLYLLDKRPELLCELYSFKVYNYEKEYKIDIPNFRTFDYDLKTSDLYEKNMYDNLFLSYLTTKSISNKYNIPLSKILTDDKVNRNDIYMA